MKPSDSFFVQDLSFSYGSRRVLQQLTLSVPRGRITTLMGANGCGKSTLFQLLTKNLTPDSGRIDLDGRPLDTVGLRALARRVAVVHQNNTAPGDMTVRQLVAYGRIPYARLGRPLSPEIDEKMVTRAMQITGVEALQNKNIRALSGGQRQRVWIAMALAQGTDILLLDEPTTYLDVRYQLQILRLISRLNKRYGITILMVLHDINQAMAYSDQIAALSPAGRLVVQGPPQQVIDPEMLHRIYGVQLQTLTHEGRKLVLTV